MAHGPDIALRYIVVIVCLRYGSKKGKHIIHQVRVGRYVGQLFCGESLRVSWDCGLLWRSRQVVVVLIKVVWCGWYSGVILGIWGVMEWSVCLMHLRSDRLSYWQYSWYTGVCRWWGVRYQSVCVVKYRK